MKLAQFEIQTYILNQFTDEGKATSSHFKAVFPEHCDKMGRKLLFCCGHALELCINKLKQT